MATIEPQLAAIGDNGKPVDWWFIYKVAGRSAPINGKRPKGTEYLYFDSTNTKGKKFVLSPYMVDDPKNGAISNTLNQIYNNADNPDQGSYFYNDEDPITGKTNGNRGHTKGIVCFNLKTNTAFWMVHSAPKFCPKGKFSYPVTAMENAQTFLCITLQDADTAKAISAQQFVAQQPNVYLASKTPAALAGTDPRASLIKNTITGNTQPYANFIPFKSKAGQSFKSIAKNKHWDKANDDDFYNDLVGPILCEDIDVETWEHGAEPGTMDSDKVHTIKAMKMVNIGALGIIPPYEWSEENDHAKLAVSTENENPRYICVGDINFTKTMEKRSGGTVAFVCDELVNELDEILTAVAIRTSNPPSVSHKKKGAVKKLPVVRKKAGTKKAVTKKKASTAHTKKASVKKALAKKSVVKKNISKPKKTNSVKRK